MSGLLNRIRRVFSANAHNAVDRAEHPEAMLNQVQRELVDATTRAKVGVNQALAWHTQLGKQRGQIELEINEAQAAAELALGQGNEDMARAAIARKHHREPKLAALGQQLEQAQTLVERQREQLQRLRADLGELREKRAVLLQRSNFARNMQRVSGSIEALPEPISEIVQRMEEKVIAQEAVANVACDDDGSEGDEKRLDGFMRGQRVDAELQQLKREINQRQL